MLCFPLAKLLSYKHEGSDRVWGQIFSRKLFSRIHFEAIVHEFPNKVLGLVHIPNYKQLNNTTVVLQKQIHSLKINNIIYI